MASIGDATTLNILARVAVSELESQGNQKFPTEGSKASNVSASSHWVLPSPTTKTVVMVKDTDDDCSPLKYLERLFAHHGIRFTGRRCSMSKSSIPRPAFEEVDAYSVETAKAVRRGDLSDLKELYYQKGFSLNACNRFGESLLHICCRRGHAKMLAFMVLEAKVSPRVIDDMGRTAFHDACWSPEPNLETMDVLLQVLPPIGLLIRDCRGHTPLEYVRRKHWGVWLQYLREREPVFLHWIREKRERAARMRNNPIPVPLSPSTA